MADEIVTVDSVTLKLPDSVLPGAALNTILDAKTPVPLTNSCVNPIPTSFNNVYQSNLAAWVLTYADNEIRVERTAGATAFQLASFSVAGKSTTTLPTGSMWQHSIDIKPPVDAHAPVAFGSIALPANVYTRITQNIVGTGVSGLPTGFSIAADADPGVGGVYTYVRHAMFVQAPPTPVIPYFDGNSAGCKWTGTVGASTSVGPGVTASIVDLSSVQTLTNKRMSPRVVTVASSGSPIPNADTTDVYILSALAATATFGAPTGTPTDGQILRIRIKDNGTARTLAWDAIYRAGGGLLPLVTVAGKQMHLEFAYNVTDAVWALLNFGWQDSSHVNVQTFLANGTWIKPPGVTTVHVQMIGGGGPGGSGRRGAAGTVRCGGGGGSPGAVADMTFTAASVPATVSVSVGTGEAGGAAVTTDDTDGAATTGSYTSTQAKFGNLLWIAGPYTNTTGAGSGGTATSGAGGVLKYEGTWPGGTGASASVAGGLGANASIATNGPVPGGAGGGITTANVAGAGGSSGTPQMITTTANPGGVVDTTAPVMSASSTGVPAIGGGGPGGAASITQAAQAGANGGAYGGGGGGGGASLNGNNSGAGGNGGPGIVVVTSW